MIKEFVEAWEEHKGEIRGKWAEKPPGEYKEVIQAVVEILPMRGGDWGERPDPERITEINHGGYQGTLLYIIGGDGYDPSMYWYVKVSYGSCSGCDTLLGISGYSDETPTEQQLDDYMTLALYVVQGLKELSDGETV